jgi:hypothetical protein
MKVSTRFIAGEGGRLDNRYVVVRLQFCHRTHSPIVFIEAQILTHAQFLRLHSDLQ